MDRSMPPPTRVWADGAGDVGWNDLLHVVMIPSYKTPLDVLRMALHVGLPKIDACKRQRGPATLQPLQDFVDI